MTSINNQKSTIKVNTNLLKNFAQQTRIRLLDAIEDKLKYVLNGDSAVLRDYSEPIEKLKKDVDRMGRRALTDKVTYTWFNRLMALRFMDANDYQPLGLRVISPIEGHTQPEILNEALQGRIPEELQVDRRKINNLLDGRITVANPQNEAYRMLLTASCNHLNGLFPFLFEKINDYTELLLPDDLISELSIIQDFVNGMTEEDCAHTEIIGWLYQFYISEKKDEVFAKKRKVEKEEIPAATQLFTPRWIVEYMVQNTVGKLWLQNNPGSALRYKMPYYIETESSQAEEFLKIDSPEEITLLDQACGSGHILVYGFELLYLIYEEAGYTASQIPRLIIEKNLSGYEIDERAAQLASFSLLMKARSYYRRLFRNPIQPNILCYRDMQLTNDEIDAVLQAVQHKPSDDLAYDLQCMQQATNLGSLIQPRTPVEELKSLQKLIEEEREIADIFLKQQLSELDVALQQLIRLSKKVCCVVDNPPYMGGGNMNKELSDFVKKNYSESKADLMACFMECGLESLHPYGMLGMINQHSWMFLSSYEKLRVKLIDNITFDTLLHLGPRTFPEIGGEVVQNAAFTFCNALPVKKGNYIRLIDYNTSEEKRSKTLEAIKNPDCEWFYTANQKDFKKIPGSNIGYWVKQNYVKWFSNNSIEKYFIVRQGLATGSNDMFIRYWQEIDFSNIHFNLKNEKESLKYKLSYVPHNKGGENRKWFGNNDYVIRYDNYTIPILEKQGNCLPSREYYFQFSIEWSRIGFNKFSVRYSGEGSVFDGASATLICNRDNFQSIIGFLNSKVALEYLRLISPSLTFQVGDVRKSPFILESTMSFSSVVKSISISRKEWDSRETSWDFLQNELIRLEGQDIEEAIDLYKAYWTKKFYELHSNEEELNKQFIEIYGLQEELTPDVPLDEITILKDELNQKALKKISDGYSNGWVLVDDECTLTTICQKPELPFDEKELVQQFVSYAVGCMFGRYSLDKEGLILANQGETLEDYFRIVNGAPSTKCKFEPDENNVIPVLESEWFVDDIVTRFRDFVKSVWGEADLQRNMDYIEKALDKPLRTYFYRDFYTDHIRRYKKRPIYWMVSSLSGTFQALIYLHRYNPDTLNDVLNDYLRPYIDKLENHVEHLNHIAIEGSQREKTQAQKDIIRVEKMIDELRAYDKEVLYPLAISRIDIDLDDGVLVNYNKFGQVLKTVDGLNDANTKKNVRKFDWIDGSEIR